MKTPNVEFLLTVPSVLRYNELAVVGTKDSYKIYIGNSKNRPVILTPEIPEAVALIESVTYSELTALIASSELVPAQKYLLTDYASVHTIPNTTDTNTPSAEPLVVTALSANTLEPIAFSLSFPQDVIYYHVDNDQTIVAGCTKGYISRRVDTIKNIDIGFDWRNVKFRRWQIEVATEDATGAVANYSKWAVVKKTGTAELYVKLNDTDAVGFTTSSWRRFEWNNLMYVSHSETEWHICDDLYSLYIPVSLSYKDFHFFSSEPTNAGVQASYTNIYNFVVAQNKNLLINLSNSVIFGNYFSNNSVGSSFYNNSVGNYFTNNSVGNEFSNNSVGNSFSNNSVGSSFSNNSVGNHFYNNSVGNYFYNNSVGNSFSNNSVGNEFSNNSVGNSFSNNSVGNEFSNNSVGNEFSNNSVGNKFSNNSVGNSFSNNTIGTGFKFNITKNPINVFDFTIATHVYEEYTTELIESSTAGIKLVYHNGTSYLTVDPTD